MADSSKTLINQGDIRDKLGLAFYMTVIRKITSDGYYDMADYDRRPHAYAQLAALVKNGHTDLAKEYNKYVVNYNDSYSNLMLDDVKQLIEQFIEQKKLEEKKKKKKKKKEARQEKKEEQDKKEKKDEIICSFDEANAIVDIVMMGLSKFDRVELMKYILKHICNKGDSSTEIEWDGELIYDAVRIEVKRIRSVSDLMSELEGIRKGSERSGCTIFYRGQSDANHILLPSVMRTDKRYEKERAMYQQLMIECPDELSQCQTHLERLSKMQHYGLPTRLLDVTRNPLVALHFACERSDERNGEIVVLLQETAKIKDFDSDTVAVLASLPLFTREEQIDISSEVNWLINNKYCRDKMRRDYPCKCCYRYVARRRWEKSELEAFNKKNLIHRLAHEVRQEKPGFLSEIVPCHLIKNYFVQALKDTPRIIRQDGAFIICGLGEDVAKDLHDFRYECVCGKKKLIIVDRHSKKDIRDELESLSIHSRSLMPEIENVAPLIESSIKDQIKSPVGANVARR